MEEVEFTWALDGYCARYGFLAQPEGLTMREAARVFQLDPQPPEAGTLNDYITAALRERNLDYFSFFLHHYEIFLYYLLTKLNMIRYSFLLFLMNHIFFLFCPILMVLLSIHQ